ncbi:MAG: sugar phosphate isomerase/epimerase [Euryarchaeota archaeon]|nr:sugar phosphate isomerase/epimerase [Euryarchaeota archaeon]
MKGRVGVSWTNVREFNPCGSVDASAVDIVELSFADVNFIELERDIVEMCRLVKESANVGYTVHAPYQNSPVDALRLNLATRCSLNLMERALELAWKIEAEGVVVHAGDALCRHALSNAVRNLRRIGRIADAYGMYLAVENVFTDERGTARVGELPRELLRLCELAGADCVSANLDVGHAYISSLLHGCSVESYFEVLRGWIIHMHLHNNHGTSGVPWDEHLPLFSGLIDYRRLRRYLRAESVVLEVKRGRMSEVPEDIAFLRGRRVKQHAHPA